jgi:lactate dehydrogenase-like 2-hydroxyacid dehydrogenase
VCGREQEKSLRRPNVREDSRRADAIVAAKIRRALLSGPECVSKNATVVEMDAHGNMITLRPGTNQWVCIPGNENIVGAADMCADPMGIRWMLDLMAGTHVGRELEGRTLGVLGLGNIGTPVARIGRAFGMRVIAWSRNLTLDTAAAAGAALVSKDELFRQADVLTIHLVLSTRTRGLVGAQELALMKPTSWLINTSRGPIVDEDALVAALASQSIGGAGLDVFAREPLPLGHPFRELENVIATPHIGYVAEDLYRTFYGDAASAIANWLKERSA